MSGPTCVRRSVRLEVRRDTTANWSNVNPTLLAGEPGFELDTKKLKIGDGSTPWNVLPYYIGATGPTGPVGPAIQFDGGGPSSSYPAGPVLDMGSTS